MFRRGEDYNTVAGRIRRQLCENPTVLRVVACTFANEVVIVVFELVLVASRCVISAAWLKYGFVAQLHVPTWYLQSVWVVVRPCLKVYGALHLFH
jgi:hypothetical protein